MTDFGLIHKTIFILCRGYTHYELFTEHFDTDFFFFWRHFQQLSDPTRSEFTALALPSPRFCLRQ